MYMYNFEVCLLYMNFMLVYPWFFENLKSL